MIASGYLTRPLRSYEQALADRERNAARNLSGVAPANAAYQAPLHDRPVAVRSVPVKGCEPAANGDGMSVNFEATDE